MPVFDVAVVLLGEEDFVRFVVAVGCQVDRSGMYDLEVLLTSIFEAAWSLCSGTRSTGPMRC